DGKTTRITQAANVAASRGMLVVNSAGNEGDNSWKYIIAPSDGDHVIGVGATNKFGFAASFTSSGPASDGDVKPNLSAMGWNNYLVRSNGTLGYNSGTSFAAPVLAGMAACLWQSSPNATAAEIKEALELSAHLYETPDSLLGYGIPDMKTAYLILNPSLAENKTKNQQWQAMPNPFTHQLFLKSTGTGWGGNVLLSVYSIDGRLLHREERAAASQILLHNLASLPAGLLILKIDSEKGSESVKLSKIR
ncbi:MAG: S8 family peptidase, partial [Prolixibacteraceae bacterium]|nr:S8 family peptidase [Prolixibacteraceae bacterium]